MVRWSLHNAGIGWQVREETREHGSTSTWSFFERSQALDFLSSRCKGSLLELNARVEISGVCFSELDLDQAPNKLSEQFTPHPNKIGGVM